MAKRKKERKKERKGRKERKEKHDGKEIRVKWLFDPNLISNFYHSPSLERHDQMHVPLLPNHRVGVSW